MSFKIAFIGAGSIGFTRKLIADLLGVPDLRDLELVLMDINEKNLQMIQALVARDLEANGRTDITLSGTMDRVAALKDARYIVNTVRIGGLEAFALDVDIPLKYGIDQCVGDTLCAGGIMYGQRVIPFMESLCADIRLHAAPDALLLNYSNPNAMVTWAANSYFGVKTLGLCHGVQHGHEQLAEALGVPVKELDYSCVGINHMTWYVSLKYRGHSYAAGEIVEALEKHPKFSQQEKVRIEVLKRFGYYSTESNGHLSEYLPWFRKRPENIPAWISLDEWIHGETGGYLRHCTERRNWFEEDFPRWMAEPPLVFSEANRSIEHGSHIIEALETGRVYRGHFNVVNGRAIPNLSPDAVVELPCYVDAHGVSVPLRDPLPDGPAALCMSNIGVQKLAVKAALSGDMFLLKQSMLLDPLTAAVCDPPEISRLADEMVVAQKAWLPQYEAAIPEAEARLADKTGSEAQAEARAAARASGGAARLAVKSVDELRRLKDSGKA